MRGSGGEPHLGGWSDQAWRTALAAAGPRRARALVDGTATAANWQDIAKKASGGLGLDITYGGEGYGASDHSSFTAARVPVAFLFTGTHDDYHKPSDEVAKIDFDKLARVTELMLRVGLAVADRPARPLPGR